MDYNNYVIHNNIINFSQNKKNHGKLTDQPLLYF
jgi:hypothetical protein